MYEVQQCRKRQLHPIIALQRLHKIAIVALLGLHQKPVFTLDLFLCQALRLVWVVLLFHVGRGIIADRGDGCRLVTFFSTMEHIERVRGMGMG